MIKVERIYKRYKCISCGCVNHLEQDGLEVTISDDESNTDVIKFNICEDCLADFAIRFVKSIED